MERFSDELRQQRERQQISLETVSEITKISRRHLSALETGDFAQLPGGVFRKGFLRSYLTAVGIGDHAPWLARFEAEQGEAAQTPLRDADIITFAENVRRMRPSTDLPDPLRWSGVAVMLALLLAFGWCVWHFAIAGHVAVTARLLPG